MYKRQTRCVPLIQQFINEGHDVVIGADGKPLAFLKEQFPKLEFLTLPGYEVTYGKKGSSLKLFCESIKFAGFVKKEKKHLDEILSNHYFDLIVSDNRYGIYSDKIESIIVTHQVYPKTPFGEGLAHQRIKKLLSKFNEVWIPDHEGENNLSGELSHAAPIALEHKFIGPLSRFDKSASSPIIEYDLCAILSGPEPQRTIFEEKILEQIELHKLNAVVVRGLPGSDEKSDANVFNHLNTVQLQDYILKSKLVVCRSGYSSIMDLTVLQKEAILVPTPGQTEQIYLAEYHKANPQFGIQQQEELDLKGYLVKL